MAVVVARMVVGNFGWEILHLGIAGLNTPIWDVLAPQGEQERALNPLRMGSRNLHFPIRQSVLSSSASLLGSLGLLFHIEKVDINTYSTFKFILPFFVGPGMQKWVYDIA